MDNETLKKILENHRHWLYKDIDDWKKMRADLCGADLCEADLCEADLRGANLCGANLCGANLCGADLRRADLCGANLRRADLCEADLCEADLRGVDLCEANLCEADLHGANLRGTNLCRVDLCEANLCEADLCGADLHGANLCGADLCEANLRGAENIPFISQSCPNKGSFIGYKKAQDDLIVELEICEDARRSSATGRKCRCDKAKVLSITNMDGTDVGVTEVTSNYKADFIYRIGEIVEEPNFCEDRFEECASGIHFFINRQEAVEY